MSNIGKIISILSGLLIIFIIVCFGDEIGWIVSKIFDFIKWLVLLDNAETGLSIAEELMIKGVAGAISYGIVRIIFSCLNLFDREGMELLCMIISIVLGFVFCAIINILNKYWYILLMTLTLILILTIILIRKINKRKEKV